MIKLVQLDPNGLCNLGCWFCPVAYEENPVIGRGTMPIETIRSIIEQLQKGIGDFVDPSWSFIYTAHYNEVLLYKHFKEMLDLFREYKVRTMVLTNGSPLTKDKMDIIKEYSDVVDIIHFNTPSADAKTWAKMTGKPEKMHQRVMDNIRYAIDNFPHQRVTMQVNGINETSLGYMELLPNAPDIDLDDNTGDTATALRQMKENFPEINIFANTHLSDRAGHLDTRGIMKNEITGKGKVVGCNNLGSRPDTWIHINANGAVFICCNDYDFETVFGNVNEKPIKEIWESQERQDMIKHSYETLCTTCIHAIWKEHPKIFINIPSYHDPEIWETVDNFYQNAKYPERIYFGITNQTDSKELHQEVLLRFPNVKMDIIEPGSIVGSQPARLNSHKFYNNEDYYMSVDSHMRVIKNWDEEIIRDFEDLQRRNGPSVITAFAAVYDKNEDGTDIIPEVTYSTSFFMSNINIENFKKNGIPQFCSYNQAYGVELPSPYVSGHFFFTSRQAILDAPFVKEVMFTEEEIFMAIRFYTAGYNLYNPKKTYIYHRYGRNHRRLFYEDFPKLWNEKDIESRAFVNKIIDNNIINKEYGLLDKRTLSEFEDYSGIDFKQRSWTEPKSVVEFKANLIQGEINK